MNGIAAMMKNIIQYINLLEIWLLPVRKGIGVRKRILVIRPDQIGDFFIWLPYGRALRSFYPSDKYELVLLGNSVWIDAAKELLLYDRYMTLDDERFLGETDYRKSILNLLTLERFDTVIEARISRYVMFDDCCRLACRARHNVVFRYTGDQAYHWKIALAQWLVDFRFNVIRIAKPYSSELENNEYFLARLTDQTISGDYDIPWPRASAREKPYFVILPEAGKRYKEWPMDKFMVIADKAARLTGWKCIIAGGMEAREKAEEKLGNNPIFENYCGKTSIMQFIALIRGAAFIVGNDTGGIHIAALAGVPSIALVGGGGLERFLPYPEKFSSRLCPPVTVTSPNCREKCNWNCRFSTDTEHPYPCIELISVDRVWERVEEMLAKMTDSAIRNR